MSPVVRRELRSLAVLPHTYGIASAYLLISGIFFAALLLTSGRPDLGRYIINVAATLVVLAPIVASRSFAEERRTGALELMLSWPQSRLVLVLGKYLVNTIFVTLLVSVMWLYVRVLSAYAEVEAGTTVAQYIGLLFLVAAFNALALAVSAHSATPTGAVIVGFGLLLALWTLDFVPGWLGGGLGERLHGLAPTNHLEPFRRGVVDAGDALYFVALAVVGLGIAHAAISDRGPCPSWWRALRAGRAVAPATLVAGVLLLLVGTTVDAQADLTPTGRHSLSAASRAILQRVHAPVDLLAFVPRGSPKELQVRSLVDTFRSGGAELRLHLVDPDLQPSVAKRHDVDHHGQTLVELDGRSELLDDLSEVDLTSALARLSALSTPRICFTVGHGERSIDDEGPRGYQKLRVRLEETAFEVVELAMGAPGGEAALRQCAAVVLAGPRVPLLPDEERLLATALQNQGRALVLGVESPAARGQLNGLLHPFGLAVSDRTVEDRSSLADDPGSIVAFDFPSEVPVTRNLKRYRIPVLLTGTAAVSARSRAIDAGEAIVMLRSSEGSRDGSGQPGPFPLAVMGDVSRLAQTPSGPAVARARIAVVGTADVAGNDYLGVMGNEEFTTALVEWIARPEDIVAAAHAPGGVDKVVFTEGRRDRIVRSSVILPTLAPLPLLLVTLRRRRRG